MARLPRVYVEGAIYYITCRSAHGENLFKENKDYAMYVDILEKYKKELAFKLFAYVLLPQHLHLLIEPSGEVKISEIMRSLNTAYSKYFNAAYNRRGHLFRERFKACLVEKESHSLRLTSYMHLNPLRMGLADSLEDYSYSSYGLYRDGHCDYEGVKEIIGYLGGLDYKDYIEGNKEELLDVYKNIKRKNILGSKQFIKKVKERIKEKEEDAIAPEDNKEDNKKNILIAVGGALLVFGLIGAISFIKSKQTKPVIQEQAGEEKPFFVKRTITLDNTEWKIECTSLNNAGKVFMDNLRFFRNKFISAEFSKQGFKAVNYSVRSEGGKIIWEAVQINNKRSLSWRGEMTNEKMRGTLSLRSPEGTQDFSFISIVLRRK